MERASSLGEHADVATVAFSSAALGAAILGSCVALGRTSPIHEDAAVIERKAAIELRNPNEPTHCIGENMLQFNASGYTFTVPSPRCNQ